MKCPRCSFKRELISEYHDLENDCWVRNEYCTKCKSAEVYKFYHNSIADKVEWVDFNE